MGDRKRGEGIMRKVFRTPLGWAGVAVTGAGVARIVLPKGDRQSAERELEAETIEPAGEGTPGKMSGLLDRAVTLLQKYFSGNNVTFDLPLDTRYYSAFQQAAWKACVAIPFGETRSYAWVAKRIGRPKAARAVGQAMGANPVPVLVP
ncbi:MAG: methylated-DNA--[protein]-cysteine S-methyltransferase [Nitrospiraceae bacterium]|nr:methylated-DNA--[protein]-cysteine S-methyltransferase [Nitrospiraceae bacterium]